MTPTQKRVFNLLASAQEPMKVELAANPSQVLNKVKSLDDELRKAESKMDKAYQEYISVMKATEKQLENFDYELSSLKVDAKNLGIDVSVIPNWKEAMDYVNRVGKAVIGLKTLYN
jgi:L-lactate utilization protein LutB